LAKLNNPRQVASLVLPKERSSPSIHPLLSNAHHIIGLLATQLTDVFAADPKSFIKSSTDTLP
jgi:hypothetical protein